MIFEVFRTPEGKENLRKLADMDLLDLRCLPDDMEELVEEAEQNRTTRNNRSNGPTLEQIKARNSEIQKRNDKRIEDRYKLFRIFMEMCMPSVRPVKSWNNDRSLKKISDFITATDEAFAMILFENNIEVFMAMGENGVTRVRDIKDYMEENGIKAKYTQAGGSDVGWDEAGMERFELLIQETKKNRVLSDDNKLTFVDMDEKFYKDHRTVAQNGMDELEMTLNGPKRRKRKRRYTEL
jgi:hypothetical protein